MKYKAIVFDMDGTIINTEHLWEESSKYILKTICNISDEDCQELLPSLKGASLYTSCTQIAMTFNTKESVQELIKIREEFVFKNFSNFAKFIDGFEEFHNNLTTLNLKSAIATNATINALHKTKEHIPLVKFFNEHIYSFEHAQKKPKPLPDVYIYAANQIGVDPINCIAIEDSAHGIAAAKAAGMFCIGINTGNDRPSLAQADLIVDHYNEINLGKIV